VHDAVLVGLAMLGYLGGGVALAKWLVTRLKTSAARRRSRAESLKALHARARLPRP
jgi:hypothetical protein